MNSKEPNKKEKEIYKQAAEKLALLMVALLDEQEAQKTRPEEPRCPESGPDG